MAGRPIFVSYSQADTATAHGLVTRVEAAGLECWVAPRDVSPAADWAAEIVDAIAAARVMVLVFSSSANNSPQVRREVERAVHRQVAVLPFRVEDVLPSKSLEYFLSSQHWLDAFPPPLEPHFARLCEYLRNLLNPGVATVPPVPAAAVRAAAPTDPQVFDAATLHVLESALAEYIGPVARHLVGRAAHHAVSVEALIRALAAEIAVDGERRRFVDACHHALRARG